MVSLFFIAGITSAKSSEEKEAIRTTLKAISKTTAAKKVELTLKDLAIKHNLVAPLAIIGVAVTKKVEVNSNQIFGIDKPYSIKYKYDNGDHEGSINFNWSF